MIDKMQARVSHRWPGAKVLFTEYNFHHFIVVTKREILYKAFILDDDLNTVTSTRFCISEDEALEEARNKIDNINK